MNGIDTKAVKAMIAEVRKPLAFRSANGVSVVAMDGGLRDDAADMLEEMLRALSSREDDVKSMIPVLLEMDEAETTRFANGGYPHLVKKWSGPLRAALLSRETKDEAPDTREKG